MVVVSKLLLACRKLLLLVLVDDCSRGCEEKAAATAVNALSFAIATDQAQPLIVFHVRRVTRQWAPSLKLASHKARDYFFSLYFVIEV